MSTDFDHRRRRFLTTAATVVGGGGLVAAAVPFVLSLQPSARARIAGGPVDVSLAGLVEGKKHTVKWHGRPIFVVHRTPETVSELSANDAMLRDPGSLQAQQPEYTRNEYRSLRPEYLVVVGLCTHFGCVPIYLPNPGEGTLGKDWRGGFYCPCHRSRFDLAGRVYKGVPAPLNLVVPPYRYVGEGKLVIGEDPGSA